MGLEGIKEIMECRAHEVVNKLLQDGNWRLLDFKIEKLRIPDGKVEVGVDGQGPSSVPRFELTYKETLSALYVVGRYQ